MILVGLAVPIINLTTSLFCRDYVSSPWLGLLSDLHGRTRMIALGALGAVFDTAIALIVVSYPQQISFKILLVGAAIGGLGGLFTAMQALIYSYTSDCTPPHPRSVTFGLLQGTQFCGIALGTSGQTYFINNTGGTLPVFKIGLLFHVIFCLAIRFIVPESLSKERQQAAHDQHRAKRADPDPSNAMCFSWKPFNPMNLIASLSILLPAAWKPSVLFPNHQGASATFFVFGGVTGTVQVIIVYAEYMFDWGNVESSLYVSIVNAVRAVVLVFGCDTLVIVLIRLSIVCDVVGYIGYALSKYSFMYGLHSSLTKHVSHERIGHLFGVMGLLYALARIIAPTFFKLIYSFTVATYPQAGFMFLIILLGVLSCMGLLVQPHGTCSLTSLETSTN
ncbi:major facilitator superfamily domain-containing protein [Aspergillus caelatus]|uniref:Major facilitator superfamily domain-containing protein n=1 Tax=Aspergillus caelatus TaxID=61420 RepID=A0A5N7AD27_9EURO|nr:major facilitator superfamily domain-containing protein [Aspergillus caelatus]KAE8366540.1 major facilitator superfamily domain-containing protein [Aspergillus caelatus]